MPTTHRPPRTPWKYLSLPLCSTAVFGLAACSSGPNPEAVSRTPDAIESPTPTSTEKEELEIVLEPGEIAGRMADQEAYVAFIGAIETFQSTGQFDDETLAGLETPALAAIAASACVAYDNEYRLLDFHDQAVEQHSLSRNDMAFIIYFGRSFCEESEQAFETFLKKAV